MRRFKNILFLADGSEGEDTVLARAAALAASNEAALTLFDAVEVSDFVPSEPELGSALDQIRDIQLDERRDELRALGEAAAKGHAGLRIGVDAQAGSTARSAIRKVVADKHDLVMKAAQGGSARLKMLFGSTDQKLMRKCPCPVWIVRPASDTFKKILAAVEINPNEIEAESLAKRIMEISTSLAASEGGELHVVHAWQLKGEVKLRGGQIDMATVERIVADMQATHQASLDALVAAHPYDKTEAHLFKGDAGDIISDFAEKNGIDLVVIGTVGRSGVPGLLIGNTAEEVLSHVECSVLTLKPEGFVTPLEA